MNTVVSGRAVSGGNIHFCAGFDSYDTQITVGKYAVVSAVAPVVASVVLTFTHQSLQSTRLDSHHLILNSHSEELTQKK